MKAWELAFKLLQTPSCDVGVLYPNEYGKLVLAEIQNVYADTVTLTDEIMGSRVFRWIEVRAGDAMFDPHDRDEET